ncbi:RNA polymerase factor sigma-70 [Thalassoglobus polymorphus]|uniref:RNA polymerase factor sigma-70 n=2 Tax=Thalassoglobus polymorphus TaxID=2527994 RepID=A0A517QTE6_9PLAN|nr:RNA polymerase factor sigma-70 [Thalassoglobus polymorphus]
MDREIMDSEESRMTSASLILGIQSGKEDAWVRMTHLFGHLVFKWIKSLSRHQFQSHDISDASQEVFLTATQKIESYRHSREKHGSFRGWLFGITRIVVLRHWEEVANTPIPNDELAQEIEWVPEDLVDGQEYDGDVWLLEMGQTYEAIEIIRTNTEPHVWQAFWRTVINGEQDAHVAEDLGMSESALRKSRYRTTKRLRKQITELDSQPPEQPEP